MTLRQSSLSLSLSPLCHVLYKENKSHSPGIYEWPNTFTTSIGLPFHFVHIHIRSYFSFCKKLFVKLVFHSLFQNLVRGIVNALQRQVNVIIFKFVQSFLLSTHFIISLLYMFSFVLLYILSCRSKVGFEGSLFKDTCKMRFNL